MEIVIKASGAATRSNESVSRREESLKTAGRGVRVWERECLINSSTECWVRNGGMGMDASPVALVAESAGKLGNGTRSVVRGEGGGEGGNGGNERF
jgi:hypothetical protein